MDKAKAKALGEATQQALQAVADEFGMTVKYTGGRYDPTVGTYAPKIEFAEADAERNEFALCAPLFGFEADDYGREFSSINGTYRLVGLKPNRPKYPCVVEKQSDGKRYKMTASQVKMAFKFAAKVGA